MTLHMLLGVLAVGMTAAELFLWGVSSPLSNRTPYLTTLAWGLYFLWGRFLWGRWVAPAAGAAAGIRHGLMRATPPRVPIVRVERHGDAWWLHDVKGNVSWPLEEGDEFRVWLGPPTDTED